MLAGQFQIILKFLYVCKSVSWLTSLLKLYKYRDISSSGWDIFLNFFGDIPEMLVHWFQIVLIYRFFEWENIWTNWIWKFSLFLSQFGYSFTYFWLMILGFFLLEDLIQICLACSLDYFICEKQILSFTLSFSLYFSVTSAFKFEYLNFIQMHLI